MSDLSRGNIYLVEEERLARAPQLFLESVRGKRGLVITRTPVDSLDQGDALSNYPNFRLGLVSNGLQVISPHNLPDISYKITDFIADRRAGVILIEGLEYLATQNGFATVLRLLQFVYDRISGSTVTMIVSLNPLAFGLKDVHQLRNEMVRCMEPAIDTEMAAEGTFALKANP